MRIGIGAILGVLGGPATYARELVRALAQVDTANVYVVITDAPERLDVVAPNVECIRAPLASPFLQPLWDHVWVPYLIRRHGIELYHGTKAMLPLIRMCPEIVTVHDLAVYHQPETFSWLQRLHQRSHTPFAVRRAVRVIADSESGRSDLLRFLKLPESRVAVVPLAAGPQFQSAPSLDDDAIAERLRLPQRYLLYAGTLQPRKNIEMLVDAFVGIQPPTDVELVIAGRLRPGYRPAFLTNPPHAVRYLGPVSDAELAVLYRRALALCSPSSYEGFGLSLLEAMTSRCLVIAGRNSSVTELVADGGLLLPELNVGTLRSAIVQALHGGAELEAVRNRALQRAGHYRWEDTARATLAVYAAAMEEVRAGA